jgi:hypothetical protein
VSAAKYKVVDALAQSGDLDTIYFAYLIFYYIKQKFYEDKTETS